MFHTQRLNSVAPLICVNKGCLLLHRLLKCHSRHISKRVESHWVMILAAFTTSSNNIMRDHGWNLITWLGNSQYKMNLMMQHRDSKLLVLAMCCVVKEGIHTRLLFNLKYFGLTRTWVVTNLARFLHMDQFCLFKIYTHPTLGD